MQGNASAVSHEVSHSTALTPSLLIQNPQPDPIAAFPTVRQPVMDTMLKDILMSLRSSLQADMLSLMHWFGHSINVLEDRVSHIKANIGDFTNTVNYIIDTQEDQAHDTNCIKDRIAYIEERSHRNNSKIRGVPESVQTPDLSAYARGPIKFLLPDTKNIELVIDRIHRLPKPTFLSDTMPRDVIFQIFFFFTSMSNLCRKLEHYAPYLTPMANCKFLRTQFSTHWGTADNSTPSLSRYVTTISSTNG